MNLVIIISLRKNSSHKEKVIQGIPIDNISVSIMMQKSRSQKSIKTKRMLAGGEKKMTLSNVYGDEMEEDQLEESVAADQIDAAVEKAVAKAVHFAVKKAVEKAVATVIDAAVEKAVEKAVTPLKREMRFLTAKANSLETKVESLTAKAESLDARILVLDAKIEMLEDAQALTQASVKLLWDLDHESKLAEIEAKLAELETFIDSFILNGGRGGGGGVCCQSYSILQKMGHMLVSETGGPPKGQKRQKRARKE